MIAGKRPRVAVFSELPTPYRWPVFRRLLDRPELSLRIFFCARTEKDREWSFEFRADRRVRFLPVRTLSKGGARSVHYHVNPTVLRELRKGAFDAVVLPGYAMFASQVGSIWCRATGTPYVLFSETTHLDDRRRLVRGIKRVLLPSIVAGASAWLATGSLSRDYLVSYGARADRVFYFPNSPDVTGFRKRSDAERGRRAELRSAFGVEEGPVVLFVARLIGVKRCDLLIDALAGLRERRGEEVAAWIAGDGNERAKLEARAAGHGLSRIRFLGNLPTDELPGLYAAADLFVLPSDHEPWGAVVGEAMACSLPVLLSDRVGSGPDLVVADGNGAVFRHGDVASLIDALDHLLSDPGRLKRMGARAREHIADFSHEACVENFLRAIEAATGRG